MLTPLPWGPLRHTITHQRHLIPSHQAPTAPRDDSDPHTGVLEPPLSPHARAPRALGPPGPRGCPIPSHRGTLRAGSGGRPRRPLSPCPLTASKPLSGAASSRRGSPPPLSGAASRIPPPFPGPPHGSRFPRAASRIPPPAFPGPPCPLTDPPPSPGPPRPLTDPPAVPSPYRRAPGRGRRPAAAPGTRPGR